MKLAHNVGNIRHPNYNTREEIIFCNEPIGFDGIYMSVYENQDILKNKSGIMFVMGDFLGKDNSFDLAYVPKLEKYCTLEQVYEMCSKYNFELGWHTWSHRDLTKLSKDEIMQELHCPFECKYFAYPYGNYNDLVIDCIKQTNFKYAWSVTQGSTNPQEKDYNFKIFRDYIK
jgi:hypothetical protein